MKIEALETRRINDTREGSYAAAFRLRLSDY